jgi:hypothetical protein
MERANGTPFEVKPGSADPVEVPTVTVSDGAVALNSEVLGLSAE